MRSLRHLPLHPQWLVFRRDGIQRGWVRDRSHGRVLDLGCADCRARDWLVNCQYVGLDYPLTARDLYGTRPDVFGDGAALPFADASFDTVLLLDVLEHVADADAVLHEIARVLRPRGRVLISMPFLYPVHDAPHDYRRYTSHGLMERVRRAGLKPQAALAWGTGFESATLLFSLACTHVVLDAASRRHWRLILAPLLLVAVPVANLLGWLLEWLLGPAPFMAIGHTIEAARPE